MICIEIPRSDKQGESNIDDDDVHYYIGERLKLEGETENMGVWTKKRGSMEAVVLMATPGPKSLHGKGVKWIAQLLKREG